MAKYLSGKIRRTPQSELTSDRYQYLTINQAEPNLGDPVLPGPTLPVGTQYQSVSIIGYPGERYWVPVGGGLVPGTISIYDEGTLTPAGGVSSITQLNFVGTAITAKGYSNLDGSPGIGVTITVFSPGTQGQVIFNNNNDFKGASGLFYDNSTNYVGIGTTVPTQELDLTGDLRLRGTIYDYNNQPGNNGEVLVKNNFGGVIWVNQSTVRAGAGGTITNIQYHNSAGLVDGATNFVFDYTNSRVGIGSTLPAYLFDVKGYSRFTGQTEIDYLRVTGVSTITTLGVSGLTTTRNLKVIGISTFDNYIDANGGAYIDNIQLGITDDNTIDTTTGDLTIGSNGGRTSITGIASVGFITATTGFVGILTVTEINIDRTRLTNLEVTGIATIKTLGVIGLTTTNYLNVIGFATSPYLNVTGIASVRDLNVTGIATINNLNVTGVGTFDNIKLDTNTVSTTTGNLTLDSDAGTTQINDDLFVNRTTESTDKDTGSIITNGGVGIEKNLNVGGASSISGIATFGSNVLPAINGTQNLGSTSQTWADVYATRFNGKFIGNADTAGYATTAGVSTNLKGSSVGSIPYQSGIDTTSFTQVGTAGSLLQSNGASAPTWINPGILKVAYATTAGIATYATSAGYATNAGIATYATNAGISTNLKAGSAGVIPYQSDISTTLFTQVGIAGSLLQSNGTSAPTWVSPQGLIVQYATKAGVATYADNAGIATYATKAGIATYATTAGFSTNAGISTNLKAGSAGVVPYQSAADTTLFTQVGIAGSLLQSNGTSAPTWVSPQGLTVQYATKAGIATYADNAGIATYATKAGIATYATTAGFSTNAGISTNLKGGSAGVVPYQSAADTTLFTQVGIAGSLLQSNGTSAPTWVSPQGLTVQYATKAGVATYAGNAGIATYATNAGISTNLKAGSAGVVPYQSNTDTTLFTQVGIAGSLLQSNGTSAPTWVSPQGLTVQYATKAGIATYADNAGIATYATNAGISTNLKGGLTGNIPYQSSPSVTTFLSNANSGWLLKSNGVGNAPSWVDPSAGFNVDTANYATKAGIATYATKAGIATYADTAGVSTNIGGGLTGNIPYQSSPGNTTFLANGTSGWLLKSNGVGNAPSWINPSSGFNVDTANYATNAGIATYATNAGIATYATNAGISTNLKGGLTGNIPYQSSSNNTVFLSNGSIGWLLKSNGVGNAPSWVDPSLGFNVDTANYATNAGIATNLKNGAINQIPYQTSANTTSFITAGTSGQVLIANASGVPTWGAVAGASQSGITIQEEGATVGTQLGISTVNFIGVGVTATSPVAGTANITISASAASNVTVTQTGYGACTNPITVTGGNAIGIGSTSNAYGTRYIQSTAPASACDGDIWYDTSGSSSGTPVGTVIYHSKSTAPTGYLKANGASLSTTTYATLFAVIGYTYGGSGASFNLPDLRGQFIRSWADDGTTYDAGRPFGQTQADDFKSHTHTWDRQDAQNDANQRPWPASNNDCIINTVNTGSTGGTETRPRNVALLACIKYI